MDGLRLVSAEFEACGYSVVQEECGPPSPIQGINQMDSIKKWADNVESTTVKKAYWATRTNKNCRKMNASLMKTLNILPSQDIDYVSVEIDNKVVLVEVGKSNTSLRTIKIRPKSMGTIVGRRGTNSFSSSLGASNVPPSRDIVLQDGEICHTFLVSKTYPEGIPIAMDISTAQYDVFGPNDEPFLSLPLKPYLRCLAKSNRLLTHEEFTRMSTQDNGFMSTYFGNSGPPLSVQTILYP